MSIEKELNQIFRFLGVDFDKNDDLKNEALTGNKVGLKARDLLILFFKVESVFKIQIPQKAIVDGRFNRYTDILNLIKELIK